MDEGKGAPVLLRHRSCGQVTQAEVVCAVCKQPLDARDAIAEPGPRYPRERLSLQSDAAHFSGAKHLSPQDDR